MSWYLIVCWRSGIKTKKKFNSWSRLCDAREKLEFVKGVADTTVERILREEF